VVVMQGALMEAGGEIGRYPAAGVLEADGLLVAFQGRLFMSYQSLMMRCRHDSTTHTMKY
jgi:hypothetical protein